MTALLAQRAELKDLSGSESNYTQRLKTLTEVFPHLQTKLLPGTQPVPALPQAIGEPAYKAYPSAPAFAQYPVEVPPIRPQPQPQVQAQDEYIYPNTNWVPAQAQTVVDQFNSQQFTTQPQIVNQVNNGLNLPKKGLYQSFVNFIDYLLLKYPRLYGFAIALLIWVLIVSLINSPKFKQLLPNFSQREAPAIKQEKPIPREKTGTPPDEPPSLQRYYAESNP